MERLPPRKSMKLWAIEHPCGASNSPRLSRVRSEQGRTLALAGASAALPVLRLRLEAVFARWPGFTCASGKAWYTSNMAKVAEKMDVTPVAFTDDLAEMADYVRSPEGRAAIERGLRYRGRPHARGQGGACFRAKRRADERRA